MRMRVAVELGAFLTDLSSTSSTRIFGKSLFLSSKKLELNESARVKMCKSLVLVLILFLSLGTATNLAEPSDDGLANQENVNRQSKTTTSGSSDSRNIFTEGGQLNTTLPLNANATQTVHNVTRSRNRNKAFEMQNTQMKSDVLNHTLSDASSNTSSSSSFSTSEQKQVNNVTLATATLVSSTSTTTAPLSTSTTMKTKIDTPTMKSSAAANNVTSSTSTTTTTTTTPKPRKPKLTKSADDDPAILESEKKIKFTTGNKADQISPPKLSEDTDSSIDEEKRARHSYALFMGVAFALPMTFVLVHILYKRVKAYMEVRHYQRVVSCLFILSLS